MAAVPAVSFGYLRIKRLEIERNQWLSKHKGHYNGGITLSGKSVVLIKWWCDNIFNLYKSLVLPDPSVELYTDASLIGWGARLQEVSTGGHWTADEVVHINLLELKAVLFGLQALCKDMQDIHIRVRSDNTTVVACVNKCGSIKEHLLQVTEDIFLWATDRSICLSAAHIPGRLNTIADDASRAYYTDAEWMIKPNFFQALCHEFSVPSLDLSVTRLNAQLDRYVSWKPDLHAYAINAF